MQKEIIDSLHLPSELRGYYRKYNGADLFSDHLSIYGFRPQKYLYDRSDWRKSFPYNIFDANQRFFDDLMSHRIVLFGSYMHDRFRVFIERTTGHVYCSTGEDLDQIRATWPSFEVWITEEIARLSDGFDENGIMLIDIEDTLPELT